MKKRFLHFFILDKNVLDFRSEKKRRKKRNNIFLLQNEKYEVEDLCKCGHDEKKNKKIFISENFFKCRDSGRYRISPNILENKYEVRVRDV